MRVLQIPISWATLLTATTTAVTLPAGPAFSAAGLVQGRADGELRGKFGNLQVYLALQFSNLEDFTTVSSNYLLSQAMIANQFYPPPPGGPLPLSVPSGIYRLCRPVWQVVLTGGATLDYGRAGGEIQIWTQ